MPRWWAAALVIGLMVLFGFVVPLVLSLTVW